MITPEPWSVLIIDDEPDIREVTRMTLMDAGYAVETAADGIEGLNRTARQLEEIVAYQDRLIESSMDGICGCEADGKVVIFNHSMEQMAGIDRNRVIGQLSLEHFFSPSEYSRLMLRTFPKGPLPAGKQEQFTEYLAMVETETDRCSKIVSSLLTFSRRSPVSMEPVAMHEVVARSNCQGHMTDRDGVTIPIRATYMALKNEKNIIVGGLATFQDMTLAHQLNRAISNRYTFHDMIGKDPAMRKIFEMVAVIAPSDATVLVEGATGTGKDLLAKVIHPDHLPDYVRQTQPLNEGLPTPIVPAASPAPEHRRILAALEKTGGHRSKAARELGMERTTL